MRRIPRLAMLRPMRIDRQPVVQQLCLRRTTWFWNDLCRFAGLDRDAQASIKRGHEPKDGNHGLFHPLGLLRWLLTSFMANPGTLVIVPAAERRRHVEFRRWSFCRSP